MRWIKKITGVFFLFLLCVGIAGCSADKKAESSEAEVEKLQAVNEIPENGIITEEQMATIAGTEGEYKFCGKGEGFTYVWTYDGSKIKNPQEQNLKVTLDNQKIEEVKKAADQASVGMGIKLETMNMAAPATLELTLEEKWDVETVIFCKYQNNKVVKINDVKIETSTVDDKDVTLLTFDVTETGDTFYLVGQGPVLPEDAAQEQGDGDGQDQEAQSSQGQDGQDSQGQDTQSSQGQDTQSSQSQNTQSSQDTQSSQSSQNTQSSQNPAPAPSTEQGGSAEVSESLTCTISIECSTILNNRDDLDPSKAEFVPSDGWILYSTEVELSAGETVFDVLKRVCANRGIHMASSYTPMYGSYYIEGINQLYEFDCGPNSGWMYRVNGWYPNYGCSSYEVSDGDKIEWRYTCDLGSDVGGGSF